MDHWAAVLVGAPYGGEAGQFRCWPLIRHIFRIRFDLDLPFVNVDSDNNERAILRAARGYGWCQALDGPKVDDVVLMRAWDGSRHVGYAVEANGRLALLHSIDPEGVCVDDFDWLPYMGFKDFTYWRRAS